jgi:hypothetical protein
VNHHPIVNIIMGVRSLTPSGLPLTRWVSTPSGLPLTRWVSIVLRVFLSCISITCQHRWSAFHAPVTTTDFKLHPEFCRRDTDKGADTDFDKVITDRVKAPGSPPTMLMKLQYEEMRIACQAGSHNLHSDMNDREPGAFHTDCMKSDMHVWIKTFFNP